MYRNPNLLPRGLSKLQWSHLGPAPTTRTWISPRKGLDYGGRQFHASPQRGNWAESLVTTIEAAANASSLSVWVLLPALGAAPHLARFCFDQIKAEKDEAAVTKVEPLMKILPVIKNNRIRKLASTAISKKIDQPKLQYTYDQFAKHKSPVIEEFHEHHVRDIVRYLFLPGTLHFGWTLLALSSLRDKSTLSVALAQLEGASDVVSALDHASTPFFLCVAWVVYMNRHPYHSILTPTTVQHVSRFWKLVTGFHWTIQDKRLYVQPEWIQYFDLTKFSDVLDSKEMQVYLGKFFCACLVGVAIWGFTPFQVLYLCGAIGAGLTRIMLSGLTRGLYALTKKRRLQGWMPLGPHYKP